jgi:hypothetical protein
VWPSAEAPSEPRRASADESSCDGWGGTPPVRHTAIFCILKLRENRVAGTPSRNSPLHVAGWVATWKHSFRFYIF